MLRLWEIVKLCSQVAKLATALIFGKDTFSKGALRSEEGPEIRHLGQFHRSPRDVVRRGSVPLPDEGHRI